MDALPHDAAGFGQRREDYVDNIRDVFVKRDPKNADTHKANAEAYKAKILAVIEPIKAELAKLPREQALARVE